MVFSSVSFLLFFLPALLFVYFLCPKRCRGLRNGVLLVFSLAFYAFGGVRYLALLLLSVAVNYSFGLIAGSAKTEAGRKRAVVSAAAAGLGLLGWFKYAGFFAGILSSMGLPVPVPEVPLPVGISFFTFQGLSYVIDVYRGQVSAQKNPMYVALYIAFFPQLVAGPIVRYSTIEEEIVSRDENLAEFSDGLVCFCCGFGKKMLLANAMGEVADAVFSIPPETLAAGTAWIGAAAYTFQIYFDFSAYSDMAIGLGRMFGFHFLPNFDDPYTACTVTDFWRRWHISLTTWFRDYLYIPLGGNRCGKTKQIRNIAAVWLLTGLWHGAAWNFLVWGAWYCALLIGEKFFYREALSRVPRPARRLYTLLAVMIGWVLFRSPTLGNAGRYLAAMFGAADAGRSASEAVYYLCQYYPEWILCLIGCLPVKRVLQTRLEEHRKNPLWTAAAVVVPKGFALAVLGLSYSRLAAGGFNPFIYFQF